MILGFKRLVALLANSSGKSLIEVKPNPDNDTSVMGQMNELMASVRIPAIFVVGEAAHEKRTKTRCA